MSLIRANYYLENYYFSFIYCSTDYTIGNFLAEANSQNEKRNLQKYENVYLRGKKLKKTDKISDYIDSLKYNAFFISNNPSKEIILQDNLQINLSDYKIEKSVNTLHFLCEVTNKSTNKKFFLENTNARGVYIRNILKNEGMVKLIGYQFNIDQKYLSKFLESTISSKITDIAIFEYFENGFVQEKKNEFLKAKSGSDTKLNSTIYSKIVYGVASTMNKIHQQNCLLRNLSLFNVFLDDNFEPKIGNFESVCFQIDNVFIDHNFNYHGLYVAPEILTQFDNSINIDLKADVYSYGTLLYSLFNNDFVLDDNKGKYRNQTNFLMRIKNGARPKRTPSIPDYYWNLIEMCWSENPSSRPSFQEIIDDFRENDGFALNEFGSKTDLAELHRYQDEIDGPKTIKSRKVSKVPKVLTSKISKISKSSESSESSESSDIENLKKKIKEYELIFPIPKKKNISENYFIDEEEEKHFQVQKKIGEGNTSITYKVIDTKKERIMCKKILKNQTNQKVAFKNMKNALKEFDVLVKVDHPCICKIIGLNPAETIKDMNIDDDSSKTATTIAIFLEYLDYNLKECLEKIEMNNTLKTKIVIEIAHAMKFIHKKGLIHRDLKIENIVLNCVFEAKLVDFGLVRIHENIFDDYSYVSDSLSKGVGTFAYMSPEMLNEDPYDYKTDVFSFGIVLYYLFVGELPKQKLNDKMAGKTIDFPKPSSSISKYCISLISKCLLKDPVERPSFEEIINDLRKNSYSLASFVDESIVSKRDHEIEFIENFTK